LVRHSSGKYYARAFANGKEVWRSLRTSHFSVAKSRLAEFLKEHREKQTAGSIEASAKMTFAGAIRRRAQTEGRVGILKNVFLGGTPLTKGFENRQLQVA
jgi:hypothetical protein